MRRQLRQSSAAGGFAVDEINWIADLSGGDPVQVNRLSRLMLELTGSVGRSDTDIASARLFYERAADAGNGRAALRMGESFDRAFLDSIGVYRSSFVCPRSSCTALRLPVFLHICAALVRRIECVP
jgi:hypothetical protein